MATAAMTANVKCIVLAVCRLKKRKYLWHLFLDGVQLPKG